MALYFLEDNSKPSFREKFSSAMQGVNRLAGAYGQLQQEKKQTNKLNQLTGMDLEGLSPDLQKLAFAANLENASKLEQLKQKEDQKKNILQSIFGGEPEEPSQRFAEEVNQPTKTQVQEPNKPAPFDFEQEDLSYNKIQKPKLIPDKALAELAMTDPALARELREQNNQKLAEYNRQIDKAFDLEKLGRKESLAKAERIQKETQPIRLDYAEKGALALESIRRKEQLNDLIDQGNLNDPTFAAVAEAIPFNLGKRLLSDDTVEYKSGLIDDFKDLRNIFTGQTRVAEIELLQDKIADIYLTNSQKKAILKARINALRADVIRSEVAAELEIEQQDKPTLGAAAFKNEVEKRTQKKLKGLADQVIDEHKYIIQQAENKKKVPLNENDPEDNQIIQQIYKEAGKDWDKAEELAKQKGYKL